MPSMPDIMKALTSLQREYDRGMPAKTCALNQEYKVFYDHPKGVKRLSYAKIVGNRIQVVAIFALADPIGSTPCFNIGYAVTPNNRGRNLAAEAVAVGIEELKHGLRRTGQGCFYVEAVIDASNLASLRVAEKVFPLPGTQITDDESGLPALHFMKLIYF